MRKADGYAIIQGPLSGPEEVDTFRCAHCSKIVHCIDPQTKKMASPYDLGGFCRQCNHMICSTCVDHGHCTPLEKQIEAMENRRRMFSELGF